MRRLLVLIALASTVVVSCGGDDTTTPTDPASTTSSSIDVVVTTSPAGTTTIPATTVAPTTVVPTTVVPTTVVPTTTAPVTTTAVPATTTTVVCPDPGSTDDLLVRFPEGMSSLHGTDIRTGRHECVERIVIEFAGTGDMPGHWLHYTDDPVPLGQTDDQFVEIRGDAVLLVHVASWMGDMETGTLWGMDPIVPTNVSAIRELVLVDNSEGMMIWAVGLDQVRPFRVFTLTSPDRLVIDLATR